MIAWLLLGLRYVLPTAIVIGGVVIMALGSESDLEGGASIISAGLAVYFVNWLFRIGARGDRERDEEAAAPGVLRAARPLAPLSACQRRRQRAGLTRSRRPAKLGERERRLLGVLADRPSLARVDHLATERAHVRERLREVAETAK